MVSSNYVYKHGDLNCHGFLAYDDSIKEKRPAIMIVHDWTGRNEFACLKAEKLAVMGYVGFALDMYGEGHNGSNIDEKAALMQPLMDDRKLLLGRLKAAFDALKELPQVDEDKIVIMGFCFGGLCALDFARSGAKIKGAISFHGLLDAPKFKSRSKVKAKILVLHGYDDPMVKPPQLIEFAEEMNSSGIDWQIHAYGNTLHSFTNPLASDPSTGLMYNSNADQRSWLTMQNFLEEIFS